MTDILAWLLVHLLFVIETFLLLLGVAIAIEEPHWYDRWFRCIKSTLQRIARRRMLSVVVVGVAALLLRLSLLPVEPVPVPTVHDEFSYLLGADTFASGRIANPPHPFWVHFETMQIDSQPKYVSMYPPAQALALALGIVLGGGPFLGVCLSAALMCAGICWALQGWLPPAWALLGGLLAVIRLGSFSYWADSYWGGAIAALGGALVLGALPRIQRQAASITSALALAAGLVLLANSRPYEGAVLGALVTCLVLASAFKRRRIRVLFARVILPMFLVLIPVAVLMLYFSWRAFGSPLRLPYQVNRATYAVAQVFVWQKPAAVPLYHHRVMRDFFVGWELPRFLEFRTLSGFIRFNASKAEMFGRFYLGPALTLPLLALFAVFADRRMRPLLVIAAVFSVALLVEAWFVPHYAAPITALVWVLLVQSMRHIRQWRWRGKPAGVALVQVVPVVCVAMLALRIGLTGAPDLLPLRWPDTWATAWSVDIHRQEVIAQLRQRGGTHLVFVRYSEHHDPFREYVFNAADIDHSPIVWARAMGPPEDLPLIRYMKGRHVWLLQPDASPWTLTPYPAISVPGTGR